MKMKKDIFDNTNPFTVPDGYFDLLQERIMSQIQAEENRTDKKARNIKIKSYHTLIAAAACILLIFTGVTLYMTSNVENSVVAETIVDDEFYQWLYASDRATLMAESLVADLHENFSAYESSYSEEDEEIIQFLERDNINVMAIVHYVDSNPLFSDQNSISGQQY